MERIFGGMSSVKTMFFNGFKIGFCVGGIFGGMMGLYYAVIYRTFYYMPAAAIGSGCSFGFFMGIGMIMRTEMEGADSENADYEIQELKFGPLGEIQTSSNKVYEKFIL